MIAVTVAIKHYSYFLLQLVLILWYLDVIPSGISVNKLCSPSPIKCCVSSHSILNSPDSGPLPGFHPYSCSTHMLGTPAGLCLAGCAQAGTMLWRMKSPLLLQRGLLLQVQKSGSRQGYPSNLRVIAKAVKSWSQSCARWCQDLIQRLSLAGFHTVVLKAEVCIEARSDRWSFLFRKFVWMKSMGFFQVQGHSHTTSVSLIAPYGYVCH